MSVQDKLAKYRNAERELARQLALMETLKHDSEIQREMEFEEALNKLLEETGVSARDLVALLAPNAPVAVAAVAEEDAAPKRTRKLQVWTNPYTGEVVESRGGNHKQLKAWSAQYGKDTVRSWLQDN